MFGPLRASPAGPVSSILFAAGRGTRLRPLTDLVAKPALPLLDVPLGLWGLRGLEVAPPSLINLSHRADTVLHTLGLDSREDMDVLIELPEPFGTGGTLRALRDRLDDRVLTWNADTLTDLSARDLMRAHEHTASLATIAVQRVERLADFVVENGRVTRFVDRRVEDSPGVRFIGVAVFERAALDLLPDRRPSGLSEDLLRPLAGSGDLACYIHHGYALDVGTIGRYLQASRDLLEGRAPAAPGPAPGEIVNVDGGRAYIGPNASVEAESLGPGAVVLEGALIAKGAVVRDAVIWPGELVPTGALVENAVWFDGDIIDPGAVRVP